MRILLNLIVLGVQGIVTFITLIVIYMIFVLLNYHGGIDTFIGTTIFQPIVGGLISMVTIAICLFVGLPIRISNRINAWWTKRIWIAIMGLLAGFSLIMLSSLPSMKETINTTIDEEIIQRQVPHVVLAATGWFLTGFSLLHLFPPYKFRIWTEEMLVKHTNARRESNDPHNF